MLILYNIASKAIVGNSGTNSLMPEGPSFELEVRNAINAHGGTPADYGEYRLHDVDDAELVGKIMAGWGYELEFENGQPVGVVLTTPPPEPEPPGPPPPDPIDELRAELAETKAALAQVEQDRLDLLEITMGLWEQINFPDL